MGSHIIGNDIASMKNTFYWASAIIVILSAMPSEKKSAHSNIRLMAMAGFALTLVLAGTGVTLAAVWTDQQDYAPGSNVTISGNNSDNAGYTAGETVNVSVNGPYNYDSSCSGIVDANGTWFCQVTLSSDYTAEGSYNYTAVGQTSKVTQSGTFTDGPPTPKITVQNVKISSPAGSAGGSTVSTGETFIIDANIKVSSGSASVTATISLPTGYSLADGSASQTKIVGTSNTDFYWDVLAPSSPSSTADISVSATALGYISDSKSFGVATVNAAALSGTLSASPSLTKAGDTITVSMNVKNTGTATANTVTPSPLVLSTPNATLSTGPTPSSAIIAGGGNQTFIWTYTAASSGTVKFSGSAAGTDQYSGTTISTDNLDSNLITVDATPPTVSIISPSNGAILTSGTFTISGTADDSESGVSEVDISTDNGLSYNKATGTNTWTYNANLADGSYTIIAKAIDSAGNSETTSISITVQTCQAISITTQPSDETKTIGNSVTFSVIVSGTSPEYQWKKDGTVISGATSDTYTINSVALSDAGTYNVTIINPCSSVTSNGATLTVNKLDQTINFGALAGMIYGDQPFTVSASATSGLPVTFSIVSGPATISGNTVTITGVGTVTVEASQAGNDTYNAAPNVDQSFIVAKGNQVISWSNPADIVYGTALDTTQLNAKVTVVGSAPAGALTYNPPSGTVLNAGNGQTLSVTAAETDHYNEATASVSINVAKADQSITFDSITDKMYGDSPFTINAKASSGLPLTFDVTGNCGLSGNIVTITGVGSCTITAHQTGDGNYNAAPDNSQTFNIAKAPLTVTTNAASKIYGASLPTFDVSYNGFVLNDGPGSLGGTLTFSTTATVSSPVGSYDVTPAGLTSDNYDIAFKPGTLTVTPASLIVTAIDNSKVYGADLPKFDVTYSDFVLGETSSVLGGALTFSTSATASSPVGNYAVTPGGLTSSNYEIKFVDGTLKVTPAPLTVTTNDASKIYGADLPSFTVSYNGFVLSDGPNSLGGTLTFSGADKSSPVGTYAITPAGLSSDNYDIAFKSGTLEVTPAPLTVTADNFTKVYGANLPTFTVSYNGFVLGETSGALAGTLSCTTTAVQFSSPGTYPITCSGQTSDNYQIKYAGGTLTIIKADTTTVVSSSANPSILGASVTFRVTVSPVAPGAGTPTGNVGLYDGSTLLKTMSLVEGNISFSVPFSSVNSHTISAQYVGDNNFNPSNSNNLIQNVQYASAGTCNGDAGHQILQPINPDGSSEFKKGSTIPAKFRVCDVNSVSIGTPGVVSDFRLIQTISGTTSSTVNEDVNSTTSDTAFRWDSTAQQWIFNINTKSLSTPKTYVYRITLNDGTTIDFRYGLPK